MLCARCNSENSEGARYCNACGSPLAPSAQPDKPLGSALTPRAAKEFDSPLPLGEFRQTAIQTDPASLPTEAAPQPKRDPLDTEPRPLYVKPIPTTKPAPPPRPTASPAGLGPWILAIASAAVLLYNAGLAIAIALYGLGHSNVVSSLSSQLVVSLTLAGAAFCGLALALPDPKITITVVAGGLLLRSLMALLFTANALGARAAAPFEWLGVSGLTAAVLWWIWLQTPRARGDSSRLSMALTVLVAAQALSAIYVFAIHPSTVHVRNVAALAISLGVLLALRAWLPAAVGDGPVR
jgi:hypothetical protein